MKIKENIVKNKITTGLGLIILTLSILDFYSIIDVEAPEGMSKTTQLIGGFVIGLALFVMPDTWIKSMISKFTGKKFAE